MSSHSQVIHPTPYTVLQRAVHIHPTIAEFIQTILGDLAPFEECPAPGTRSWRARMPALHQSART